MTQNPNFQDWIDSSSNTSPDKYDLVKYMRALRDNVATVLPSGSAASNSLEYLDLMDKPLNQVGIDSDVMVTALRHLYDEIDVLKDDVPGFFAMFGEEFGWSVSEQKGFDPYYYIGKCRTALDQYARFLMGVDSSLAKHAAYTRHHYETNYQIKPPPNSNVLELPNDWEKMRTLVNDYQSMEGAMNRTAFKSKHGLSRVHHLGGIFYFYF